MFRECEIFVLPIMKAHARKVLEVSGCGMHGTIF